MSEYRESGMYDVPADSINLAVDMGSEQPSYDSGRYMDKQRECAKGVKSKLSKEKLSNPRYS